MTSTKIRIEKGFLPFTNLFIVGHEPDFNYVVRNYCCGKYEILTHKQVTSKRNSGRSRVRRGLRVAVCRDCRGYKRKVPMQKASKGFLWAVPPSVPRGYWLWQDRQTT